MPQTQSNNSGMNIRNKGIFTSYLGRLDICSTSTNDPGSSFTISPFCEITDNLHFSDTINGNVISFKDLDYLNR